jgi:hypothetical protein
MHTNFCLENLKGRNHLGHLRSDGGIIKEILREGVDWIHLAHNIDQSRALVNMVMNLRVP